MSKRSYSDIVDVKTPMSPMFTPFKSSQRRRSTSSYRFRASQLKIFNDPIHQSIKMEGLCLRIIDTVEFQRLHHLKQLGVCDYVFRGATHSRFIHSLGVAHLAEKLICHLRDKQPELNITESDILCVKVAGLCHDLGHGPFSHVFDGVFMRKMHPHGVPDPENTDKLKEWKHEEGSVYMLRHILECNEIFVEDYGLNQDDVIFIEEMILGNSLLKIVFILLVFRINNLFFF